MGLFDKKPKYRIHQHPDIEGYPNHYLIQYFDNKEKDWRPVKGMAFIAVSSDNSLDVTGGIYKPLLFIVDNEF